MIPTQNEVAAHLKSSFHRMVRFANIRFDISSDLARTAFTASFRDCKRLGMGGIKCVRGVRRPFIKLNIHDVIKYPVVGYSEYRSFNDNRRIGGFRTTDWRLWVDALIAHELAHVIQFILPGSQSRLRKDAVTFEGLPRFESNHGDFFRAIYAILREEFVNPQLDAIGGFQGSNFNKPEGTVSPRMQRTRITENFPFQGRKVHLGSLRLEVIEFNRSARKYPFVAITPAGKRYKISQAQLVGGLQAA
jgi:hypothetical protein